MEHKFKIGEIIEHTLSKDWVMVIGYSEEKYICRTKQFGLVKLNDFEVRKVKK